MRIIVYDMINIWSVTSLLLLCLCAWYCVGTCGGQRWKWSLLLSLLVFQESNSHFWACTSVITPKPSASPHLYIFLSLISGIQKLWCFTVRTPGYSLRFIVNLQWQYRTKDLCLLSQCPAPILFPAHTLVLIYCYYVRFVKDMPAFLKIEDPVSI